MQPPSLHLIFGSFEKALKPASVRALLSERFRLLRALEVDLNLYLNHVLADELKRWWVQKGLLLTALAVNLEEVDLLWSSGELAEDCQRSYGALGVRPHAQRLVGDVGWRRCACRCVVKRVDGAAIWLHGLLEI
jgi:hypothetical protein